jgi:hypothetical protein
MTPAQSSTSRASTTASTIKTCRLPELSALPVAGRPGPGPGICWPIGGTEGCRYGCCAGGTDAAPRAWEPETGRGTGGYGGRACPDIG